MKSDKKILVAFILNLLFSIFEFDFNNLKLPAFKLENENHFEHLKNKCLNGLNSKFENPKKEYFDRLEYELNIINKMGFVDYFLIVADFVKG